VFVLEADSVHGSLHDVDLVSVAGISGVHAASIFKDDVGRVGECQETHEEKGEVWCLVLVSSFSKQGNLIENGPTKIHREL
jgi:hypothetical protein